MAAYDALDGFVSSLSEIERGTMKNELKTLRAELLAARSEDARVRLVQEFIQTIRDPHVAIRRG